jgi:hypothetical protein
MIYTCYTKLTRPKLVFGVQSVSREIFRFLHIAKKLKDNQRFMTYYGQENAQLDRLHPPMPEDIVDHPGMRALANLMLWGIPNHHYSTLHDLFVHNQVYVDHWQTFITARVSEWRGLLVWVRRPSHVIYWFQLSWRSGIFGPDVSLISRFC